MKNVILAAALAASTVPVQADVTGSVGAVSDYRFRGISQSDRNVAIQGDITYNHASGVHVGAWASSIDFDDSAGNIEADYTIGFGGPILGTFTYDFGATYYDYINADSDTDLNFYEVYGSLGAGVGPVDVIGKISYSPDYFGETGRSIYTEVDASFGFPQNVTLVGHAGYQYIEDGDEFFTDNEVNYIDYRVGLEKALNNLTLGAYYVGTDLNENESCVGVGYCDDAVVFQLKLDI